MSDERAKKIHERAYRLWEEEGQPHGRDLDHWVTAERQVDGPSSQQNEGEGNRMAARAYDQKAKKFAESGTVDEQARKAREAVDGPEGPALREAERVGSSHSHGEDPTLKG